MDDRQEVKHPTKGGNLAFPRLLGERLCLDFANSIDEPRQDPPLDFLREYADLVHWGQHVGLLDADRAERILKEAARHPAKADAAFTRAVALRAAITRVFTALAAGSTPEQGDLSLIARTYLSGLTHAQLAARGEHFAWAWEGAAANRLESVLWPIARSAVDLLTDGDLARVKQCTGPDGCDWLFYDTSKNGSRRWCSMEGCGSRAKMRRYNARRRAARA